MSKPDYWQKKKARGQPICAGYSPSHWLTVCKNFILTAPLWDLCILLREGSSISVQFGTFSPWDLKWMNIIIILNNNLSPNPSVCTRTHLRPITPKIIYINSLNIKRDISGKSFRLISLFIIYGFKNSCSTSTKPCGTGCTK